MERYFRSFRRAFHIYLWWICLAEHDPSQIKNGKIRNYAEIQLNRTEKLEKVDFL